MAEVFLISDMHFGHENCITKFKRPDGSPLRVFDDGAHMDRTMVERWNAAVRPDDKVYVEGDCVINAKNLPILGTLNGRKRLIRGNHDIFHLDEYRKYFSEIYGVRVLEDMILSHVPLHPDSLGRPRWATNVHGHLHDKEVTLPDGTIDSRYLNVSVEQIDYRPINIKEVRALIAARRRVYPPPAPRFPMKGAD